MTSHHSSLHLLSSILILIVSSTYGCSVIETAGYVEVRPSAHMFWLLQYSTHPDGYLNRPWIIWLQGGPGISGTGYANYMMFGPEDLDGNKRPTTWVQSASIIYVDNPIDTGFSYFSNGTDYEVTIDEISRDLVSFLKHFLQNHAEFQSMPLYIFGQSYGGRMAPAFAYHLEMARQAGDVQCNLVAVAIGNGAVSDLDSLSCESEMLYQMSFIDDHKHDLLERNMADMWEALEANDLRRLSSLATAHYKQTIYLPISRFDITQDPATATSMYDEDLLPIITSKMMTEFRSKFDFIPDDVTWNGDDIEVRMRTNHINRLGTVHHLIDRLLFNSTLQIIVYSGQYDIACCTSSQLAWIRRLTWPGVETFYNGERTALLAPGSNETEMFVKATDRLKFYWMMRSGHVVPRDVPEAALRMFNRILDNTDM